jgi:hypothetical protein
MRIPSEATIDDSKLTDHLLMQRAWDDKSGYLRRSGFDLKNWSDLRAAIRRLEGLLEGPMANLQVVCIWMRQAIDDRFRFVTLKPSKGRSSDVSSTV